MRTAVRESVIPNYGLSSVNLQEPALQELKDDEDILLEQIYADVDLSIDPDFESKPLYTINEYIDGLAKKLGQHYGLNDIREAR